MSSDLDLDPLFKELGMATYAFQAIEARIKVLLPHLSVPTTEQAPPDEGWEGRNKYLESKEMLGNLVKLLQQRMRVDDPARLELEWRAVVQGRNEVVHHLVHQPFARCENSAQLGEAIQFVRSRRLRALPLLRMLDHLLQGFVVALSLPPDFEGEVPVEMPAWSRDSAA